jgi:trehalose/maltose hydrolase-like predicted phosphorylase
MVNFDRWRVIEEDFYPESQHHKETIFTIGNGYLSTRGSFEERYPQDRQATLIHGLWDDIPISFTELVNAPDWTSLEIWVNNKRFDMGVGDHSDYSRSIDLKTGILHRRLNWRPDKDQTRISLEFNRFASLADQHICVVQAKITPQNAGMDIRVRASLDGHVENEGFLHWSTVHQESNTHQANLVVTTRKTGKILAMSTRVTISGGLTIRSANDSRGCPGIEAQIKSQKGETVIIEKYVGIVTSRDTEQPLSLAIRMANSAAKLGYDELVWGNQVYWNEFWNQSDVIIRGDELAQIAIRHALFQFRIAAPIDDETVSIGAKSLSGFGYRGHVFWDTEIFILPFFTLTQPEISRNLLMYRYHTLPGARRKAKKNGYSGAQYSWESAETGDEVTPTWVPDPANPLNLIRIWTGDIEIHISSDIAFAMYQYWQITGDDDFWCNVGIPIVLETAKFYGDRAEAENGQFSIRDVIGPDEYHEHVDNNIYTNRMIQWHLATAIKAFEWLKINYPSKYKLLQQELNLSGERLTHWKNVQDNLVILQEQDTGLFEQFEGFFNLKEVEWHQYQDRSKSMQEILGIEETNKYQVIKQADVIMLLCLLRNEYAASTWKVNWEYYNPRTDHTYGSSLGPAIHAWAACEMGQPNLAYDHFTRAASVDLFDVRKNAGDGIHAASAGGLWQAIVFGFAGLNFKEGQPVINPRLPEQWDSLSFSIQYRNTQYSVEITQTDYCIRTLI